MEKAVLIELSSGYVKMTTIKLLGGTYHKITDEITEVIRFDEDILENQSVSIPKLNECIKILNMFKNLCEFKGILKYYCVASPIFVNVKNFRGLFEEISTATGFNFNVISEEEQVKYVYHAVLNAVEPNKAVMLYVNPESTLLINFAKRNLISSKILPFGSNTLAFKFRDSEDSKQIVDDMIAFVKEQMADVEFEYNEEEAGFIIGGQIPVSIGRLVRKMTHYPLDMDNNTVVTDGAFEKAFDVVKELGFDRTKKLSSNISTERLDNMLGGFAIVEAFKQKFEIEKMTVTTKTYQDTLICTKILRESLSDISSIDVLERSLENDKFYHRVEESNSEWVYELTVNLFKQMSIIHKLTRKHVKALKIAAFLYDCGKRIDFENHSKYSAQIILNSKIIGASHRDIIVAAFACQCQNLENFQLSEWVKYRNIVDEEDLVAARKIGVLIKLADSLDCNKQQKVQEVNCDLLGDIVIIKVKTNGDASYEMAEASKLSSSFKKIFNKNFQII